MARLNIPIKITGDPANPTPDSTLSADELNTITPSVNGAYDGLDAANTLITQLQSQITASIGGFKGSLAIATTPTAGIAGYYFPSENGTYTNAGGIVVSLSDGLNIITQTAANVFSKIIIPITLTGYATKTDLIPLVGVKTTKSPNLYDVRVGTFGNILINGGTAQVNASYNISDYIPATVGKIYTSFWDKIPTKAATTTRYYFYNSAKVAIGSTFTAVGSSGETIAAPANTAFIRISYNNTKSQYFQVIEGDTIAATATSFSLFGYFLGSDTTIPLIADPKLISNAVTDQSIKDLIATGITEKRRFILSRNEAYIVDSVNLINTNAAGVQVDKSISPTTGLPVTTSGWTASDYFEVFPGLNYAGIGGNAAYYDANKVLIANGLTVVDGSNNPIAPPLAAYARISVQTTGFANKMVVQAISVPTDFVTYGETFDPKLIKVLDTRIDSPIVLPFEGKNWIALGDSITFQSLYIKALRLATGLNVPTNFGVSGQVLKTMADSLTSSNMATTDIVTLLGGTNDYGHGSTTLGTIADDKTVNSIYGVIKYLLDKILTLKPTVQVVFFTPLNRGTFTGAPTEPVPPAVNPNGLTIQNIGQAMQETCRLYGIPCFDLGGNGLLNSYNFATYLQDGLHPNQTYATKMGWLMGKFINRQYGG